MSEAAFGPVDRVFLSREALVGALAIDIAARLDAAIEARRAALFVASGGSSPGPLYERLARAPIDWSRVTVLLADERWVEPGAPGSNETMVRETLLQGRAAGARLVGLKTPGATPQDGAAEARARLANLSWPIDAGVLGMGPDGHALSWFPHADGLDAALAPAGDARCVPIRAVRSAVTGDHVERITLTRSALKGAGLLALMIQGEEKRDTLAAARADGPEEDMPVRALLRAADVNVRVYWAP